MCTLVYLGSDRRVRVLPWNPAVPGFHVRELEERERPVRDKFSVPFVYYVGTDELCGCGFSYGRYPEYEDPEEAKRNQERVAELRGFVSALASSGARVELYACPAEGEGGPASSRRLLRTEDIGGDRFWLEERELVELALQSA